MLSASPEAPSFAIRVECEQQADGASRVIGRVARSAATLQGVGSVIGSLLLEQVVALAAVLRVVACAPVEVVVAVAALERVVARQAAEGVVLPVPA